MKTIKIHPSDNVAVALSALACGETVTHDDVTVTATEDIMRGHKIALYDIAEGEPIIKYGNPIAVATPTTSTPASLKAVNTFTTIRSMTCRIPLPGPSTATSERTAEQPSATSSGSFRSSAA